MSQAVLAPIALTCGEPCGVGIEVAIKAAHAMKVREQKSPVPFFWIGDPRHLPAGTSFAEITDPQQVAHVPAGVLPVLCHSFAAPAEPSVPNLANSQGVIDVIERAVQLVQSGAASAMCTAPIHKKLLKDGADFAYPGHTEFLAALAKTDSVVMMLACSELRVVPATIHIALKDVPSAFTPECLESTIRVTSADLEKHWGMKTPRIAIAGLNPHAGEGGAMGMEELDWMIPLLERMRKEGFDLKGPMPPDTMFHAKARTGYDVAICAYHDQALIPIKTIDFAGGVNVTLGLPFIRTSPDHGTAMDIAERGIADPTSLIAALDMAWEMAQASQT